MSQFFAARRSRATFISCPVCNKQAKPASDPDSSGLKAGSTEKTTVSAHPALASLGVSGINDTTAGQAHDFTQPAAKASLSIQEQSTSSHEMLAGTQEMRSCESRQGYQCVNNGSLQHASTTSNVNPLDTAHGNNTLSQQQSGQKRKIHAIHCGGPAEHKKPNLAEEISEFMNFTTDNRSEQVAVAGMNSVKPCIEFSTKAAWHFAEQNRRADQTLHDAVCNGLPENTASGCSMQTTGGHDRQHCLKRTSPKGDLEHSKLVESSSQVWCEAPELLHPSNAGGSNRCIQPQKSAYHNQQSHPDEQNNRLHSSHQSSHQNATRLPVCLETQVGETQKFTEGPVVKVHHTNQQHGPHSTECNTKNSTTHSNDKSCIDLQTFDKKSKIHRQIGQDVSAHFEKSSSAAALIAEERLTASACVPRLAPGPPLDIQVLPHHELNGQILIQNFLRPEEEHLVVALADSPHPPWRSSTFNGRYRGKAWGAVPDLRARLISDAKVPMTPLLLDVAHRMRQVLPLLANFHPNECNAIDYHRGTHVLTPHVDDRKRQVLRIVIAYDNYRKLSTEFICNLCLLGRVIMTFAREKGPQHEVRILLPPRSLQILSKDSRYSYTHAISKEDVLDPRRISITFRQSPITRPQSDKKLDIRRFIGKQKAGQ